jgi:hypothetical protein
MVLSGLYRSSIFGSVQPSSAQTLFGLVGLVDEWVHRDFKETPEEMADIFIHDILQPLK